MKAQSLPLFFHSENSCITLFDKRLAAHGFLTVPILRLVLFIAPLKKDCQKRINELELSESERKRSEEALRESEARIREVLENSLDVSYKRNLQTDGYDYLSPVFTKIFIPVSGEEVRMTVSIGLAQYKPQEEMKVFVHRVDQLMHQGKKNGKDWICSES